MSKMPDEKKYLETITNVEFETGYTVNGRIEYGKIIETTVLPDKSSMIIETGVTDLFRYTYLERIYSWRLGN